MERLTVRCRNEVIPKDTIVCGDCGDELMSCDAFCMYNGYRCDDCAIQKCFDKLAEYEDAEEQGLLLRLPTNRVWFICDAKTKYSTIMSKTIDDLCIYDIKELLKGNSKRYFMTEDEAKQALAKMKEV